MDFIDRLRDIAARIPKHALVMPDCAVERCTILPTFGRKMRH